MSDMHLSTTWYQAHSSASVGASDGAKSRPTVSSSHLADLNGLFATLAGLSTSMRRLLPGMEKAHCHR